MGHAQLVKQKVHFGHGVPAKNQLSSRDVPASCHTGGFYKSPTSGQQLNATAPFTLSWDPSCLNSTNADIFLYASAAASTEVHGWTGVPVASGSLTDNFDPTWWSSTTTANLQFVIVEAGQPSFLKEYPPGPVFTVSYPAGSTSASAAPISTPSITNYGSTSAAAAVSKGPSKGAIAAAVLVPLLALGLGIFLYIRWKRSKTANKSRNFANNVDRRMSMASAQWRPSTAAGANAAMRQSRASAYSFGAVRPVSSYSDVNGGQIYQHDNYPIGGERRERMGSNNSTAPRASRISFAADPPRPSESRSRRSMANSRAFPDDYPPPVPQHVNGGLQYDAQPLTNDDITAHAVAGRDSIADYMPALRMMRTSEEDNGNVVSHHQLETPAVPESLEQPQLIPSNVMTPDAMLQAYAARKAALPRGSPSPAYPAPVAKYNGNGARTLYSPEGEGAGAPPQSIGQQGYSYVKGGYTVGAYMPYTNESQ